MGIRKILKRAGERASDTVAKLSTLSPGQLENIENKRNEYLSQVPSVSDENAAELTNRLLGASSIEIFNAYLPRLNDIYVPVEDTAEYGSKYMTGHNVRYIRITKWVTDKAENSLEKLVNVYQSLSNENCNIGLVFHRKTTGTDVYLAVANTQNSDNNVEINNYINRLTDSIRGNFPGSEWEENDETDTVPCLRREKPYSVAIASNAPTEKSEKFISQTIEKLLDGIVPDSIKKEYIIILLATPAKDLDERKLQLAQFYSALMPYSSWQTDFNYTENNAENSSATFGVNAGVNAGLQQGVNRSVAESQSETGSESKSLSTSDSETISESKGSSISNTEGQNSSISVAEGDSYTKSSNNTIGASVNASAGGSAGVPFVAEGHADVGVGVHGEHSWGESNTISNTISNSIGKNASKTVAENIASSVGKTVGKTIANTLGKAVTQGLTQTRGISAGTSLGANFGANFARSSNVTITVGKNEGIHQSFINYNIKHALDILEEQTKRLEEGTALGMWDFAAYVLSEDTNTVSNVAHSYLALTQGEESYKSTTAVNVWRGDLGDQSDNAKMIFKYLKDFRHPIFGLNPGIVSVQDDYYLYPMMVTATTSLSGKELAFALNFPKHAISGLPILECAEFGRNIVSYDTYFGYDKTIELGNIFHMNHVENTPVNLSLESLKSHAFITGSTGSGKSNTVYKLIDNARKQDVHFLVVEPAKGEYKNIFGNDEDVLVYGTNPELSPLLRINPFSFPDGIHILEHLDRLIEIFNVCWPMYAAMPAVLKSAVEKAYTDAGWDLISSKNQYSKELYPDFSDVARNVKEIIESSEYDEENKGAYKGSLLTRLQSLTNGINGLIFCSDEIDNNDLFNKNVIVDLSRVGSTETKSLIMGMLVLKLQECRMTEDIQMNSKIRHITVLEEAHNLLRRTSIEQATEGSNLLGKSVEMLSNAIAEMRTYGEGFIIVDQAPGLMDMSVIRNTNTKIIMRLPDYSDRDLVGKSAALNDDQIKELSKLPRGVAAVYQNEWIQPILCRVDRYKGEVFAYKFDNSNENIIRNKQQITESLLNCIMDKELTYSGEKRDLKELKDIIIRSGLSSMVKVDLIEYINAEKEEGVNKLGKLLYDFLHAKEAIIKSEDIRDIDEWIENFLNELNPSIEKYNKKQIDMATMLILQEQTVRDNRYRHVLDSFIEKYQEKGGVF